MLILTIWPLFALICGGFALARSGWPSEAFWSAAERLNYWVLFPALLVSELSDAPLGDASVLRLGGAAVVAILIAWAFLTLWGRARGTAPARQGPLLQGVIRFNTYLGLAVTVSLLGPDGLGPAAVLLAVAVPLVNLLSVLALTPRDRAPGVLALLRPIVGNPLILGCAVGIALSLTGIGLPLGSDRFAGLLAQASLPLGLLCVGAALRPAAARAEVGTLASVSVLRLVAMPVLAAGVAAVMGLGAAEATILIVFTAIPTAPTSYVLTTAMRGDGELMAGIVTVQTLCSVATIPLILSLLI